MSPDELRSIHLIPYYHHDYAWCSTRSWHIWRYIRAFEETLDGDVTVQYAVTFDGNTGDPVLITDADGHETEVVWE